MTPEDDAVERWEEIEKYLDGTLSERERHQFEHMMKTQADLEKEVAVVKRLRTSITAYTTEQRMLDTLAQLQRQDQSEARPARRRWYAGGLAAACLAGLLYFSFVPVSLPDAGYDIQVIRSADDATLSPVQRRTFEQFFAGQARMAEGQYVQAVDHFGQVLQQPDLRPYFREAAQWHLAVAYLRSNQPRQANKLYTALERCDACEYRVNWLNRSKMKWQITWQQWLR